MEVTTVRLIDADALKEDFRKWLASDNDFRTIGNIIDEAPTIDAEPVRHGRWIKDDYYSSWICSECGAVVRHNCFDYCNCGAKMDGGAEG